ncbi:MAG: ribonuclease H-like domain-containing protein [Mycoplasmoidaceae bacterium]
MEDYSYKKKSFLNKKIVIFDIRTTEDGLNSSILHFASRTYINNEMISKDNFYINSDQIISEYVRRKYRITRNKINSEGIKFSDALERIANIFDEGILFAYNGNDFIFPLIEKIFTDNDYFLDLSKIDILKLAQSIIGFDFNLSFTDLCIKLGIIYDDTKFLSATYSVLILEKIWFRLKSFIL